MQKGLKKPEKIVYVASTHWDREWYRTFQSFRFRLVQVMDDIIETLESNPAFSRFMLDGQTVPLEDYLEIRPENRERLGKLMAEGRLIAGPWYTMPDENLVSGESLVNNLRLGFSLALGFGVEPMKIGYVCDVFGHIAQLPQILRGFGIGGAVLGRGTNRFETPAFFIWQAPDGSRSVAFKVPEEYGYGTFYFDVIAPFQSGRDTSRENMLERAKRYVEAELNRTTLPYVLLMDGMDHERIHPEAVWLAEELGKAYGCPVVFGTPEEVLSGLTGEQGLPVMEGELQQTARDMVEHNKLLPHTLSARYDVKHRNDACQTLWERLVSPLSALSALSGKPVPSRYFEIAERLMAQNQAHDSICGCSIDQVSLDVLQRYHQAEEIGREVAEFALGAICDLRDEAAPVPPEARMPLDFLKNGAIDFAGRAARADRLRLTLYNPEPEDFSGVVEADICFPAGYTANYGEYLAYEKHNMFRLFDSSGTEVPYQLLRLEKGVFVDSPSSFYRVHRDRYRVALRASIPAMGSAELAVIPSGTPVRNAGSLLTSALSAENEFLRLRLDEAGRVSIEDKATGRAYEDLISFRDEGEIGDGWFHAREPGDRAVIGRGGAVDIELMHDGSEMCRFSITRILRVPAFMEQGPNEMRRSKELVELPIRSELTLSRGARWVDVKTTVNNTARDHRLKLCLETGVNSLEYEADQAFAIVRRKAGLPRHTHAWKEFDRGDHSFSHLILRRDVSGEGLAFLSRGGLHECMAQDDARGTLEITLLRSFGRTFLTNGEPGGQLQGELVFRFALMPISKADTNGRLARLRDRYLNDMLSRTSLVHAEYTPAVSGHGFRLHAEEIALSTIRPAGREGFICVRLVNYGEKREAARLDCPRVIEEAFMANMLEDRMGEARFCGTRLDAELAPHEVATYLLRFSQNG